MLVTRRDYSVKHIKRLLDNKTFQQVFRSQNSAFDKHTQLNLSFAFTTILQAVVSCTVLGKKW